MSLSKPLKIQKLPIVIFEHVLHQMRPIDIFELSNCSEKMRRRMGTARLASHCDIEWDECHAEISIKMKSGGTLRWCFRSMATRYPKSSEAYEVGKKTPLRYFWHQFKRTFFSTRQGYSPPKSPKYSEYSNYTKIDSIIIDGKLEFENYKNADADTIYSICFYCPEVSGLLCNRIFTIFPCPVRNLSILFGLIRWDNSYVKFENLFDWESVSKCENLEVNYFGSNSIFSEICDNIEVSNCKKVCVYNPSMCTCSECVLNFQKICSEYPKEPLDLSQFFDVPELSIRKEAPVTREQLSSLNNEHLELFIGYILHYDLKELIIRWMNGDYEKLKTLKCAFAKALRSFNPQSLLDELNVEMPVATGSQQCLVKFSDDVYLDCTPTIVPDHFCTFPIRSRTGKTGTVVLTAMCLHFVVWNNPVSTIQIPNGHMLKRLPPYPFRLISPRFPTVFENETEAIKEGEGLLSINTVNEMPLFSDVF